MDNTYLKQQLTLEELSILESEMLKKRKGKEAAWGLWAGLSFFGAHRFYTEDYKYASVMLTTTIIPIIGLILILIYGSDTDSTWFLVRLFLIFLAGSVVWSWIDAFFLNRRLETLNNEIEQKILQDIMQKRERHGA
ncbi:MAG: hypothetical protein H0Z33_13895 [Bacillaceae bacterium]|nr:hypothetical protein [Bacillaceae bacterium]